MTTGQAFTDRIPYSEQLLTGLERLLSTSLGIPRAKLKFTRKAATEKVFYCQFQSAEDSLFEVYEQPDKRRENWVIAKAIKKGASQASVWVGCRMRFEHVLEKKDFLVSISLLFLSKVDDFYPLIRAEWDYRGLREEKHAQPHWHMLTALRALTVADIGSSGETIEFQPSQVLAEHEQAEDIHLAMATDWQSPSGSKYTHVLPDDKSLMNWVGRTTNYSIGQIMYVLNQDSERERPTTGQLQVFPAGSV